MNLQHLLDSEHARILLMVMIILFSVLLGLIIKKGIHALFKKSIAKGKTDPGSYVLWIFLLRLIILIVGVSYAISLDPHIESITTSLLASAGVATAIIGFAAKDTLSNMVSGATIIIFRPFTIGHWIKVGDITEGTVEEIKMLYTVIRDYTNRRLIIPNSKILSTDIINSSYRTEDVMEVVAFDISYESDLDKAKEIIQKVAEASPLCIDKRTKVQKENNDPIAVVKLSKFDTYAITLTVSIWVDNPRDAKKMNWVLNEDIRKQFHDEGIQFPYPSLIVRKEHTLS